MAFIIKHLSPPPRRPPAPSQPAPLPRSAQLSSSTGASFSQSSCRWSKSAELTDTL
jgi:hypothetical protein